MTHLGRVTLIGSELHNSSASNGGGRMARLGRIALVTPFPYASRQTHGVANYSRELACALSAAGMDVEVWADRLAEPHQDDAHQVQGAKVLRNWQPGVTAGAHLIRALRRRRPDLVHVQMEHFVFGGLLGLASLQPFLLAVRAAGIPLYVTLHHVAGTQVTAAVLRESGIRMSPGLARVLQDMASRFLGGVATRVIVHDEVFRQRLIRDSRLDPSRVDVIPHGVPRQRRSLRSHRPATLLMFGYLKWYKGVDIAIEAFGRISDAFPDARLVIAGGLPQSLGRQHPHRGYVERVRRLGARLGGRVEFPGYVADEDVPDLYDAATVVLFPYRALFGASGPLALAIGYRKPFLVSDVLKPLVPFWPLTAPNTAEGWAAAIRQALLMADLQDFTEGMLDAVASLRQWPRIAAATIESYRSAGVLSRPTFDVP
jgi:glycosyltransferase involved in cell wall biosynthesis